MVVAERIRAELQSLLDDSLAARSPAASAAAEEADFSMGLAESARRMLEDPQMDIDSTIKELLVDMPEA